MSCLCFCFYNLKGSCFIRTDQLDGETDWKLKVAVSYTQRLPALGVSIFTMFHFFYHILVCFEEVKFFLIPYNKIIFYILAF